MKGRLQSSRMVKNMEKYELGIYKKGEEDLGAADVLLTNASFDECFKAMSNKTLSDGECFRYVLF